MERREQDNKQTFSIRNCEQTSRFYLLLHSDGKEESTIYFQNALDSIPVHMYRRSLLKTSGNIHLIINYLFVLRSLRYENTVFRF